RVNSPKLRSGLFFGFTVEGARGIMLTLKGLLNRYRHWRPWSEGRPAGLPSPVRALSSQMPPFRDFPVSNLAEPFQLAEAQVSLKAVFRRFLQHIVREFLGRFCGCETSSVKTQLLELFSGLEPVRRLQVAHKRSRQTLRPFHRCFLALRRKSSTRRSWFESRIRFWVK